MTRWVLLAFVPWWTSCLPETKCVASTPAVELTQTHVESYRNSFSPPLPRASADRSLVEAFLATWAATGAQSTDADILRRGLVEFRRNVDEADRESKLRLAQDELQLHLGNCTEHGR